MQTTLDKDVMPAVHVFGFLQWLVGAIVVAIIGVLVNKTVGNRKTEKPA
ncbi:MAG: hypothetical protein WA672_17675 [Candidatus Angelobacter sp.]